MTVEPERETPGAVTITEFPGQITFGPPTTSAQTSNTPSGFALILRSRSRPRQAIGSPAPSTKRHSLRHSSLPRHSGVLMATFQDIRGQIEIKVRDAYAPTPVCFDNVDEDPVLHARLCDLHHQLALNDRTRALPRRRDGGEHPGQPADQLLRPRGKGMKPLEEMGATAMTVMNTLYDWSNTTRIKCSQVQGPTPVLSGDDPLAVITTSCAFTARAA